MLRLLIFFLFIFSSFFVFSQSRVVSGTVKTESGVAVPGATVQQKGTSNYASAADDGRYSITVNGNDVVLVFSSAGFKTAEFRVGNGSARDVVLASAGAMDEVVVTALGITRSQKSIGYSTQQVKGENLTLTKEQNVLGSLAGKIAGVQVVGASGASLGGTQKIKIRGVNSLNGNDQPLIVVDGTPISNSNFGSSIGNGPDLGNLGQDINPDDIETVNVLKGPAASALYGLRGQYGVILITTKKGGKGAKKVDVQYSSAFSTEKAANFMPLQNIYGVGNNQTFLTLANGDKYVNGNDESWGPKMDGTPVRMYY
ncbi:MAG: SusC/RagA family TonB-linked outer membrane protein, partial [Chitinophagaceae bacterium]